MDAFFYRFEGLDLLAGNKTAGFVFWVRTETLQALSTLPVSAEASAALMRDAQERLARARVLTKPQRAQTSIGWLKGSACPRYFVQDAAFGGSLGADPEELARLQQPGWQESLGESLAFTPHNVDTPQQALALWILAQAWAEWAQEQLLAHETVLAQRAILRPYPAYGLTLTLDEFQADADSGALISDDGEGYYATAEGISDVSVWSGRPLPAWATHVVWFNR